MNRKIFKIVDLFNGKTIAKCTLIERGWTKKMIKTFFPKPTYQVPNPHFATAPTMKLYCIEDVVSIERSPCFINYWNRIAHKREVARAMMVERHRKKKELVLVPHTDGMSNQCA